MKTQLVILFFLAVGVNGLYAQDEFQPEFSGFIRNYTGILTDDDMSLAILQNTLDLKISGNTNRIGFKANPYIFHYTDRELSIGLREAYMDLFFKNFDIRLGKQQIIWGKAEGVFITDVVSPKDLSEFLLPDFDEIRMGVTSLKLNYYKGNHNFEVVWAPVFTPTLMPDGESIWSPVMPFPLQPEWDLSKSEINPSIKNSEVFARYALMASAFDLEFVGGSFYYDDPAFHLTRTFDLSTQQLTGIVASPEYHRVSMLGGSFSVPFSGFVLRGEGAYYSGRYFQTNDPTDPDATVEKDNLHYMAGLDYTLAGTKLSLQFIEEFIPEYNDKLMNREFENTMTFLAKKDFLREKLWIEFFAYVGLSSKDALIRPKVTYAFADGFEILGGANLFTGKDGRFGQYDQNDMLYFKVKYSF